MAESCPLCRRPRNFHRYGQWCGPLTGTAAGPMTESERAEYETGWAAQRRAIDLTHPRSESTLVHMTSRCHCLGCLHNVHCRNKPCREGCPR